MQRGATIDIGTNSVLLLVAERGPTGGWQPLLERAEITRLGRGVDKTRRLAPDAIEDTVRALEGFAAQARALGASRIVATATSAARDSANGGELLAAAKHRAGVDIEIISGAEEAQLSFASAHADFGGTQPLVVIDIGGGSTEFIFGEPSGRIAFRHSFDVGSVRMTERFISTDPPSPSELTALDDALRVTFASMPARPPQVRVVAVAGTATTVCALAHDVEPYDASRVHGAKLTLREIGEAMARLAAVPLSERRTFRGLQPKRADVIVAGARVLHASLVALGVEHCEISDRGLRWGLLASRFGSAP